MTLCSHFFSGIVLEIHHTFPILNWQILCAVLLQYLSDVHLEFRQKLPRVVPKGDILILAGDIGYPFSGLYEEFLRKMTHSFKKVFLVVGNHEYYNLGKES
jgi:hypothetical protein